MPGEPVGEPVRSVEIALGNYTTCYEHQVTWNYVQTFDAVLSRILKACLQAVLDGQLKFGTMDERLEVAD